MRPVDTDAINAEIERCKQRKQQIDGQLEERLPDLEAKRARVVDEIEALREELETAQSKLERTRGDQVGFRTHGVFRPRRLRDGPVHAARLARGIEAIDSERIAKLIEYFESYVPYLVVALLDEDAQAVDVEHNTVSKIGSASNS